MLSRTRSNAFAAAACAWLVVAAVRPAWAQQNQTATELRPAGARGLAATVRTQAPIYLTPDSAREPLRIAAVGSALRVVGTQGDWANVEFQDPQFGRRYGFMLARMLSIENPDLKPLDLSVVPDAAQPDRPPMSTTRLRPPGVEPDNTASPVTRRATVADTPVTNGAGGWVTLDLGQFRPREKSVTVTRTFTLYRETGGASTSYGALPSDQDILPAFGARIWHRLGFHIAIDAQNYSDTVGLAIAIPSPYYTNTTGYDAAVSKDPLVRKDRAIDMGASVAIIDTARVRLLAVGGPTLFHVSNEMVSDVTYAQSAYVVLPINVVTISNIDTKTVTATAIGWHVGADLAVFGTPHVGIGLTIGYNAGKANLTEPLANTSAELRLGHFHTSGGLRLRF